MTISTSESGKEERLFQVVFDLDEDIAAWAPAYMERLWAKKTEIKMQMEIQSIPFYIKNIALHDVVKIRIDHDRREFVFEELASESGHSTIRTILFDQGKSNDLKDILVSSGLSWEVDSSGLLWAIDVPVEFSYSSLRCSLLALVENGTIDLQEAALGRGHRKVLDD